MKSGAIPAGARPTRTEGSVGQSYTVWETNWKCTACDAENRPTLDKCFRCREPKPVGASSAVFASSGTSKWQEAFDPNTKQVYYYNVETRESQWQRPEELGPAPHATGWFGRGALGGESTSIYEQNIKEWLKRPARKQAEMDLSKMGYKEGANDYNIWYDKYMGEHWNERLQKGEPAPTRCCLETDAGYTAASKQSNEHCYFCIHFARGSCAKGKTCNYYHHLPSSTDDTKINTTRDAFGRERFQNHRDDMGGVGSYMDESRTLYICGFSLSVYGNAEKTHNVMWKHFAEWGEIENINVIPRLSIAFVRYRLRLNAEFAREAMYHQSLDGNEILDVRWARDDPNPVAKEAAARANEDAFILAMKARGFAMVDAATLQSVGAEAPVEQTGQSPLAGQERQQQLESFEKENKENYDLWMKYYAQLAANQSAQADSEGNAQEEAVEVQDPSAKLESLLNAIDENREASNDLNKTIDGQDNQDKTLKRPRGQSDTQEADTDLQPNASKQRTD